MCILKGKRFIKGNSGSHRVILSQNRVGKQIEETLSNRRAPPSSVNSGPGLGGGSFPGVPLELPSPREQLDKESEQEVERRRRERARGCLRFGRQCKE